MIADHYDAVSVLFADIVGFTERSSVMAADELVALLDEMFSAFDRLADAEGLEKIKTIGDAYMVVGGLARATAGPRSRRLPEWRSTMRDEIGRSPSGPDGAGSRFGSESTPGRSWRA